MADIDFGGSPTDPALEPLATATYLIALKDTGVGAEPLEARVVAASEIAPLASPTFTGTVTLPTGQVVNGVTLTTGGASTEYLSADGTYSEPAGGSSITVISNTQTGTQNDWAPTGISGDTVVNWAGTSPVTATGLPAGTNGQTIEFHNRSASSVMVFAHQFASSTAANRFALQNPLTHTLLTPGDRIALVYSTASSRWEQRGAVAGGIRTFGLHLGQRVGSGGTPSAFGILHTSNGGSLGWYQDSADRFRANGFHYGNTASGTNSVSGTRGATATAPVVGGFLYNAAVNFSGANGQTQFVGLFNSTAAPVGTSDWGAFTSAMLGVGIDTADTNLFAYHGDDGGTPTRATMGASFTTVTALWYEVFVYMPPGGGSATIVAWPATNLTILPYAGEFTSAIPASNRILNNYIAIGNRAAGGVVGIQWGYQNLWRP